MPASEAAGQRAALSEPAALARATTSEAANMRGEELRLLYVAMTRARDTLILTASVTEKKWDAALDGTRRGHGAKILAAKSYADWLGLWFAATTRRAVQRGRAGCPNLRWRIADDAELAGEKPERGKQKPETELPELNNETSRTLRERFAWQYGFGPATERAAKSSVTALRRQADELADEAEQIFNFPTARTRRVRNPKLNAADAGTAHHKFLQHVSLENADDPVALKAGAERLEREKVLSADERGVLDLKAVAAFWSSDAGQKIRHQAAHVRRELAFTAKFSLNELDGLVGSSRGAPVSNEFVVVQGVADLVVLLPQEIWLVDFKTDEVSAGGLPGKTKLYTPQLKLYAGALAKIYARPVTNCWLYFLAARRTERIECGD